MLNIISKYALSDEVGGPQKVVKNLTKGLDMIGCPYVINGAMDSCRRLWIVDDLIALKKIGSLKDDIRVIVGPILYVLPREIPESINLDRVVYLTPSNWVKNFWIKMGFNRCQLSVWPVGIDTDEFKPSQAVKNKILIYWKQRSEEELELVIEEVKKRGLEYAVIQYGKYKENDYKNLLASSKFVIWLGRQESQGIALEEALAMNVPVLIWEPNFLGHWCAPDREMKRFNTVENNYQPVTSAEYFDERCGVKIYDKSEIGQAIDEIINNLDSFSPREYIMENLSIEGQARKFLEIYNKHFGATSDDGFAEIRNNNRKLFSGTLIYKLYYKFLEKVKKAVKYIIGYHNIKSK